MISEARLLRDAVVPSREKILNPARVGAVLPDLPVLVILAAGKGTRFGQNPKCIQPVHGVPLARHSIDSFRRLSASPAICMVGYRHEEVSAALGGDNIYVRSDNPAGGTAFAAYEAFSVPGLLEADPLLIITMGDRIVPSAVFRSLWETHLGAGREASLTFLTAIYEPPKNRGKGRVLRDEYRRVTRIVEERDIVSESDGIERQALLSLTEGNCPLYAIRASALHRHLSSFTNANAQGQFYLTDIVEAMAKEGGDIRTVTTTPANPEYDLLCSDVTQPMDLALLEGILASSRGLLFPEETEIEEAARELMAGRPAVQVAAIARQLEELTAAAIKERLGFKADRPVAIGVAGGRLRIAFMHPDMQRFFGPAWQMPIGAGTPEGDEQIVVFTQAAHDRRIHLFPINPKYRENINHVAADSDAMYPGEDIADLHAYEEFGTRMSETLLLSLGYFTEDEVEMRRQRGLPLPPPSLWVGNSMRRPFALVGNAIASLRTLRAGNLGARVQEHLGRHHFEGLRLISTGSIPEGGFSSSSALTVATKNAINALFNLGIPPDLLVHLACQAEYGTGVRAGSLDQATEQKGRAGQGTLISSNPRENYRIIATYPVPAERFQIIFPYTVDRDRTAWRWSGGFYAEAAGAGPLTTSEARKMTGKSAEIAALLTRFPLDTDFFKPIEEDLVSDGLLNVESRQYICSILRQLPLLASQEDLRKRTCENLDCYGGQLTEAVVASLFTGWRDAMLRRGAVRETGVPLRAMVAYLFGEVAKNFYLIHNPEQWIECVTWSQRGDRCFDIDPGRLPEREGMEAHQGWENGHEGPGLLSAWLDRFEAVPFDYNRGLDDASLAALPEFHRLEGSNFFRGLALIDLAEAMLKRAFGSDAVAVRVNAAGQGDFFQVHIDKEKADPAAVKRFISAAIYRRFGLSPSPEFVEVHPGGGAAGVRLSRYDALPQLISRLRR